MNNLIGDLIINKEYAEFVEKVFQMVSDKMGSQFRVRKECANKNNDTIRRGINISDSKDTSPGLRITPTIYLEEYYERYMAGCDLAKIVRHIIKLYYEISSPFQFNMEYFEFDNMKDKICFKLINKGMNQNLLECMPHRSFCDLAVTYYVLIVNDESGVGTLPIDDHLMTYWGVNEDTLWEFANRNTRKLLPPLFQTVDEALHGCNSEKEECCSDELISYVLSNGRKHLGAACILYEGILDDISEKIQSSYFILPSSIHEWFILADNGEPDKESCNALIQDTNSTQLAKEDLLSDHVYYYDREQRKLFY